MTVVAHLSFFVIMSLIGQTVVVSDLPVDYSEETVHKYFEEYGPVLYVFPATRDSAYVVYRFVASAERAKVKGDGMEFHDSNVTVKACTEDRSKELDAFVGRERSRSTDVSQLCVQLAALAPGEIKTVLGFVQDQLQSRSGSQSEPDGMDSYYDQSVHKEHVAQSARLNSSAAPDTVSSGTTSGQPPVVPTSSQVPRVTSSSVNPGLYQAPRLSFFSGDSQKGEVSFEIWQAEVLSLREAGYLDAAIMYAVRRSLRGVAADLVLNLGVQASIDRVFDKFQRVFGTVSTPEVLLEQYYSSRQSVDESVATWACRLEELLRKLQDRGCQLEGQSVVMLRSKFWSGLKDASVKNAIRHLYDSRASYDDLLVAARRAEQEESSGSVSSHQMTSQASQYQTLLDEISKLNKRIDDMTKRRNPNRPFKGKCYNCFQIGHKKANCPLPSEKPSEN